MSCHECDCARCRAERTPRNIHGRTTGFHCVGNAKDLVETLIVELRYLSNHVTVVDGEAGEGSQSGRREAVIILYATGAVAVFEGWHVERDDIPELLAAKVLKDR